MFSRPVDPGIAVKRYYGEKGRRYQWSIDPDNGFWIPVKNSDGFGQHRGTDFECPTGTLVRAMADGVVIRCRHENSLDPKVGAGLYILQLLNLLDYDSWILKYSHLKAVYVQPGEQVYRFQAIAESGDSGDTDSSYLHVDLMNLHRQWKAIQVEV